MEIWTIKEESEDWDQAVAMENTNGELEDGDMSSSSDTEEHPVKLEDEESDMLSCDLPAPAPALKNPMDDTEDRSSVGSVTPEEDLDTVAADRKMLISGDGREAAQSAVQSAAQSAVPSGQSSEQITATHPQTAAASTSSGEATRQGNPGNQWYQKIKCMVDMGDGLWGIYEGYQLPPDFPVPATKPRRCNCWSLHGRTDSTAAGSLPAQRVVKSTRSRRRRLQAKRENDRIKELEAERAYLKSLYGKVNGRYDQ